MNIFVSQASKKCCLIPLLKRLLLKSALPSNLNALQASLSELDQDDVDQRGTKWGRLRHEPGNENIDRNKVRYVFIYLDLSTFFFQLSPHHDNVSIVANH